MVYFLATERGDHLLINAGLPSLQFISLHCEGGKKKEWKKCEC